MSAQTLTLILNAVLLVVLLSVSAFFSASEAAFSSITRVELRRLRKGQTKKERTVARILAEPSRMITTLLVGNNIVNIWASSLATAFALETFGVEGVGIATAAMTVAILLFSEITPKTLAAGDHYRTALALAPAVSLAQNVLQPLVISFSLVNTFFLSILHRLLPDSAHRLTGDELKTMMEVGKKEGALEEGEHRLLKRAFSFTDLRLREIMTPRTSIAAVPLDADADEIRSQFRSQRYSRLPVYDESIDSIQGMIHYKDVLFLAETEPSGLRESLRSLLRPVLFVPETATPFALLGEMEKHGQHLAIVVDEHGGTAGLVTIKDALEAVFGSIRDEYDTAEQEPIDRVQILGPDHLRVPGNLKLDELNALVGTCLDSPWFETVGGFVLEKAERLPVRGTHVSFGNLDFTVEETSGRRIETIDINLQAKE